MKQALSKIYDIPAIMSGIVYGASMFGAGFILGAIRMLYFAPKLGELMAVLVEMPFMLLICWYLSKQCLLAWYCCQVCLVWSEEHTDINTMGVAAFSTLLLLEYFLSVTLLHRTLGDLEEDFTSAKGTAGLIAQVVASSFPMIQLSMQERLSRRR